MGENTKIEWCDHTQNFWMGCAKVSPACDHCYAEAMMADRYGRVQWGAGEDRVRTAPANWRKPYAWDRAAREAGKRATVFCLSLGDIWDNEVDPIWRRDAFKVMRETPNLIWLLLSKRIGNARKMCDPCAGNYCLPENAALGATVVNQDEWDRDIPKLKEAGLDLGALFTFASVEPMLGPINARGVLPDWVIVGGESGAHARPMHPQWVRDIRDQCASAGTPFFFKQWGEWTSGENAADVYGTLEAAWWFNRAWQRRRVTERESEEMTYEDGPDCWRVGKRRAGRLLDGMTHDALPLAAETAP